MAHFLGMNRFLRSLGLFDSFTTVLSVPPKDLMADLAKNVDRDQPYLFDIFTSRKKQFRGTVKEDEFELRKPMNFTIPIDHLSEAHGKVINQNNSLALTVNIQSFHAFPVLLIFSFISVIAILIGLGLIYFVIGKDEFIYGLLSALGLWAFTALFLFMPIYFMKWSIRNLKKDIERLLNEIQDKTSHNKMHMQ